MLLLTVFLIFSVSAINCSVSKPNHFTSEDIDSEIFPQKTVMKEFTNDESMTSNNDGEVTLPISNSQPSNIESFLELRDTDGSRLEDDGILLKVRDIHDIVEKENINVKKTSFETINADLYKLRQILKNYLQTFITAKYFSLTGQRQKSVSDGLPDSVDKDNAFEVTSTKEKQSNKHVSGEESTSARQFVFHPYLLYGKDIEPDEKISIHDVLPVKMVKFIKSMVEEAPWEQMFMKMVRMVVDQFVDKIIEKMFAHKEDEDKWRSLDGIPTNMFRPSIKDIPQKFLLSLLKNNLTPVERHRRSASQTKSEQDIQKTGIDISSTNQLSKDEQSKPKSQPEEESWLDSILDFLFPEDQKENTFEDSNMEDEVSIHHRIKRYTDDVPAMAKIMSTFLERYKQFEPNPTPQQLKDYNIRDYIFQNLVDSEGVLPPVDNKYKKRRFYFKSSPDTLNDDDHDDFDLNKEKEISAEDGSETSTLVVTDQSSDYDNRRKFYFESLTDKQEDDYDLDQDDPMESFLESEREISTFLTPDKNPKKSRTLDLVSYKKQLHSEAGKSLRRSKRSFSEEIDKSNEVKRLWQSDRRSRPSSYKPGDECSLRRACNTGRLLSRIPSVPDLTLQLKGYDNEPHWDALVWGLTKKKCTKIYCKRQRSPKGSKHHWHISEKRHHKKTASPTRTPRLWFQGEEDGLIFTD